MASINHMRIFVRVVEAGNFSSVARQMGIAPSSVSRQINELEDELGVRLFQRTTRKLSLTEAGELYHERAAKIILDIDEAALAVSHLDGSPSGVLRINVPASLSRRYLVPALYDFQQAYPAIKVVMTVGDHIIDIFEKQIDLTIRIGRLQDSSFIAKKIISSRRVLCASPAYLDQHSPISCPNDLLDHNCITFRLHPGSNLWTFQKNKTKTDVRITGNLFTTDGESLVAAALAGYGLILVPDRLINEELAKGELVEVLPEYHTIPKESPIYAIYPKQQHLPPKVRVFIDFLTERFD